MGLRSPRHMVIDSKKKKKKTQVSPIRDHVLCMGSPEPIRLTQWVN